MSGEKESFHFHMQRSCVVISPLFNEAQPRRIFFTLPPPRMKTRAQWLIKPPSWLWMASQGSFRDGNQRRQRAPRSLSFRRCVQGLWWISQITTRAFAANGRISRRSSPEQVTDSSNSPSPSSSSSALGFQLLVN